MDLRIRAQERLNNESESERESRLANLRRTAQQRLSNESESERESRLADLRRTAQQRLNEETDDEREARLADINVRARERQQESENTRIGRLAEMNATAQRQLDQESSDERDARLGDMRVRTRQSAIFDDALITKMNTFHKKMSNCDYLACAYCNESFPADNPKSSCTHCIRDKHHPKLYSHDNNTDPDILSPELQGLSQIEVLISWPIWIQWSCFEFTSNVSSFAKQLPRLPSELDIVLVRKVYESGSHKDFRVRHSNVLHALQWLKVNNKYYRNISIDDQALQQLPRDGDVTHCILTIHDDEQVSDEQ